MDWIVKEEDEHISYVKIGHELDCFEIIQSGEIYSVKVPLREADCIYTTRFSNMDDAKRFVDYHLQLYLSF